MVIIDIESNTSVGGLTLGPAGMHCPSWDDAFVSSCYLHSITDLLSSNPFVIVFALDFSKAFDTVRHCKIAILNIPDVVYNWIVEFFSESHLQDIKDPLQLCWIYRPA